MGLFCALAESDVAMPVTSRPQSIQANPDCFINRIEIPFKLNTAHHSTFKATSSSKGLVQAH
ncbi:MAG: hypothetical protein ACKOXN_05035, partial [Limnohabitans sp.]